MDKPGYITPPPGLIPDAPNETSATVRLPERKPTLPAFVPAVPGVAPAAPPPAAAPLASSPPTVSAPATVPPAAAPSARQWALVLHDGSVVHTSGTFLLGRDPARVEGWESASLLRINDPEKSVSKTHAALDCSGEVLRITDLHSTNGVSVTAPGGATTVIAPGASTEVVSGSTIELGRYRIVAETR